MFQKLIPFLVIGALSAPVSVQAGAIVEGSVELPPASPPPTNQRYQLKAGEVGKPEPRTAVVFLEGNFPAKTADVDKTRTEVVQKSFQFQSGLTPVRLGTTVEFPNHDDDYHNVFSYSKPRRFDLGRYRKDEKPPSVTFDQPGVVKLYCEIHEHMRSTILVLDTPYFVKTTPEGRFRLENLPAGKFTLKAWLDEKTVLEQPVELKDGETLRVEFKAAKPPARLAARPTAGAMERDLPRWNLLFAFGPHVPLPILSDNVAK